MPASRPEEPLTPRQLMLRALARGVLIALALFLAANFCALVLRTLIHPQFALAALRREKSRLERQVDEKQQVNKSLKDQLAWMDTRDGRIETGHKHMKGLPGEEALVVTPPAPAAVAVASTPRTGMGVIDPRFRIASLFFTVLLFAYGVLLLRRRRLINARRPDAPGVLTPRSELTRRRQAQSTDER